jgi:PKD repeat protein
MNTFTKGKRRIRAHGKVPWLALSIVLIAVSMVPVQAALNPAFTGTPRSGVSPLSVQFTDTSTGFVEPVTYYWDFGDGNTSNKPDPLYTYNKPGTYAVKLNMSNASGELATVTQTDYISVEAPIISEPLNPDFTGTPLTGTSPLTVQFKDTSTGPHDKWVWDFGDGNTSSQQNPLYTFYKSGSFTIKLDISNASGEQATITQKDYIIVESPKIPVPLNPDFTGTPRSGVTPLTVKFNDISTGPHDHWEWDFGDGNTSAEQKPQYTYYKQGSYNVKLVISNTSGEQATITQDNYITVNPAPQKGELVLDFNATPRSGVSPLTVQFYDLSTGFVEPVNYNWDFGDGNTSTEHNPLYTYNHQGSYRITLNISQSAGAPASLAKNNYITVESPQIPAPLNPAFTGTPRSGVAPLAVQFNDTSTGKHDHWEWDFGDGNSSSEQKPHYVYNESGSFNVKLTISTSSGEQATIVQDNYITVNPAPQKGELVLDFNATPRSGNMPLTVQFYDLSTGFIEPVTYLWDFGDGNTSSEHNPLYIYYYKGSYRVILNVSQSGGAPASVAKNNYILITSVVPVLPLADFSGIPTSGNAPLTVAFTDLTTNTPISWNWSFGDDSRENATEQNPVHTFSVAGNYTVSLFAANANGSDIQTRNEYIKVNPVVVHLTPPVADFSGKPSTGDAPLTISFKDLSTNTPTSWTWSFGDNSTENATQQNPVHTYTNPGNFTVSLNATNADGSDTQTRTEYIKVNAVPLSQPVATPPVADFSGKPTTGDAPLTISFKDLSTNTPISWTWSFGDNSTENTTEQNPVHTYINPGNYTVSLNATNADGSDTQTRNEYIKVNPVLVHLTPPVADFSGKPTTGDAPLTVAFKDLSTNTPKSWTWSFGDNSTENTTEQNPVHTYTNLGNYTVSLNATNADGSDTQTRTEYIKVNAVPLSQPVATPPVADFSGKPTSGDSPLTVAFKDLSTNTPTSWTWSFGDNSTENTTEQNPVHTYTEAGNFSISLNATNADGSNTKIRTGYINVSAVSLAPLIPESLVPNFTATPTSGPAPLTVQFNDTSTGLHDQWEWKFGDDNSSLEQNPLYTYNEPGSYSVILNVSQTGGDSISTTQKDYITVVTPLIPVPLNTTPPVPNFTATPTSGPAPLTVQFNDTSTGLHDQWEWKFGDGTSSLEQNPLYTYNEPGSYSVLLNVSQTGGGSVSTIYHNFIKVSAVPLTPPVADFSGKPTSGVAPLVVTFTDLSTNTPTAWNWSFGDDSLENATQQNPVHSYTNPGTYTVSLNATNAAGLNITTKRSYINITAAPVGPVVDFSGTPTSGISPLTVQFNDTSTGFVNPTTYHWDFGDGSTSTEQNPSHTYTANTSENFTVTLNVTGNYGQTGSIIKSVYITIEIPTIELIISDSTSNQSLVLTSSISPEQSISQAQSLTPGKSELRAQSFQMAQSLPQSIPEYKDRSFPEDISPQKDFAADNEVLPITGINWQLHSNENILNSAFWMKVLTRYDWIVMVYDARNNGKPSGTEGKMAEYNYNSNRYITGGKFLQNPLRVQSESGPEISLSEIKRILQTGKGTPPGVDPHKYYINLKQFVETHDSGLSTGEGYRIVITFEASIPW